MNSILKAATLVAIVAAVLLALVPAVYAEGEIVTVDGDDNAAMEAAVAQLDDGDTLRLTQDVVLRFTDGETDDAVPAITIVKDITLDLNGHSITWDPEQFSEELVSTALILCIDGCDVTITGNGMVDAEFGYNNSYGINVMSGGSLTVESGTFKGATTAIQVSKGSLTILGGTFDLSATIKSAAPEYAKYIINCIDANYKDGSAAVDIKGGSFGYDYSQNVEGDGGSPYVSPGFKIEMGQDGMSVASAITEDEAYFQSGDLYFYDLASAVESIDTAGTVTVIRDFTMYDDGLVTIPEGKSVVLDMNGMKAKAKAGYSSTERYIVNNGSLTVTGNGTVDFAGEPGSYGFVKNYGTLVVKNGTYHGDKNSLGAFFRNCAGGTATFVDGVYDGAGTIILSEADSVNYILGGSYSNDLYPALDMNGRTEISGGSFSSESCVTCNGGGNRFGYCLRSGNSDDNAYLLIKEADGKEITVSGVQGALAVVGGNADIYGGTFTTHQCDQGHDTAHYACYVAGEAYETEATIYGGTFTSYDKPALYIGNSNDPPDSGAGETSLVLVRGGTFSVTKPDANVRPISVQNAANAVGAASISGGTFVDMSGNELDGYLVDGYTLNDDGTVVESPDADFVAEVDGTKYTTLAEAFAMASDGSTITLLDHVVLDAAISLSDGRSLTLDMGGFNISTELSDSLINVLHGSLTLTGTGKLSVPMTEVAPVILFGSTDPEAEDYSKISVGVNVTLEGYFGLQVKRTTSTEETQYGVVVDIHGKLVGLTDTSAEGYHGAAINVNGLILGEGNLPVINIRPGAILNGHDDALGIYGAGDAVWNVKGATIIGSTGIELRNGTMTIADSKVTSTAKTYQVIENHNGRTTTGAAIAIAPYYEEGRGTISLTVKSGEFTGPVAFSQANINEVQSPAYEISVTDGTFMSTGTDADGDAYPAIVTEEGFEPFVSGGSFSSDVSDYCVDGFTASENADGTFGISEEVTVVFDMPDGVQDVSYTIVKGSVVPSVPGAPVGYTASFTANGVAWDPASAVTGDITVSVTYVLDAPTVSVEGVVDGIEAKVTASATSAAEVTYTFSAVGPDGVAVEMDGASFTTQYPGAYTVTVTATGQYGTASATGTIDITFEDQETAEDEVYVDVDPGSTDSTFEVGDLDVAIDDVSHGNIHMSVEEAETVDIDGYGESDLAFDLSIEGSALSGDVTITVTIPVDVPEGKHIAEGSALVVYLPDDGGDAVEMETSIGEDGYSVVFVTTHFSEYHVYYDLEDDLPPFIPFPPEQGGDPVEVGPIEPGSASSGDEGNDTLKVVAVAAAAVVAAFLIIVWASTYRKN